MREAGGWNGWRPAAIVRDNMVFARGTVLDYIFTPAEIVDLTKLSSKRSGASKRQLGHRRSLILANTRQIISESGFGNVHMRQLAERSEVTPPTIYALVGTKHEVVQQALLEGLEAKFALAERRAALEAINPILAFGAVKWDAIVGDPGYYRQIMRGATSGSLDLSTVLTIHATIADRFLLWFEEMTASGFLRKDAPFPPSVVAPLIARQFAVPISSWVTERITLAQLRPDVIASLAVPLLGVVAETERDRMLAWLEREQLSASRCP